MTSGYEPHQGQPGPATGPAGAAPAAPRPVTPGVPAMPAPRSGAEEPAEGRSGPLPPRIEPPRYQPAPPAPTGGPAAPAAGWTGAPYAGQPTTPVPAQPGGAFPAGPAPGPQAGMAGGIPAVRTRRLAWPGVTALLLVLALLAVVGVQAYQLNRLTERLGRAEHRTAEAQAADRVRFDGLERRAEALEKQAGNVFNPEAISSAVLPSVFRVRAGDFTGTAFAVGKPAGGGGTNLFTNFHVVESVWDGGGRQVFLERTDQRFPATIVKIDKANDVAQLQTAGKFSGLVTASQAVKSGQQIVVVGAPLGLEDSVTTGVVSAFRKSEDGSGPVIQFDAPINPGNSGGPVINGAKQVVGIASAKARDAEGIGLAIPIAVACGGFKIC
jgi:putative serine protease PepD